MIELIARAAAAVPDAVAVTGDAGDTTYRELDRRARSVARALRERGITRLGIVDTDPARVMAVLAGASLAGVEACVYQELETDEQVEAVALRFDHVVLVAGRDLDVPGITVHPAEALCTAHPDEAGELTLPEGRPHLVLTTGTTGAQRGVRHDWSRLLLATRRIRPTSGHRWLLAYGMNQFGGLQILLHVLAAQATLVAAHRTRPREGLQAMRTHGVTHASGTPTFWRFVLAEIAADGNPAPALQQVTLGGEAVPAPLLDRLRGVFAGANISQIYGATEFGQNVTVRDDEHGLPVSMLDGDADVALKVVDGQLWVRSRASMLGYYGEASIDPDAWRPTGDLVQVVGDRVLFRGRVSEIVNVGGVKVHPVVVEERVSAVPGIALARVFGRPNAMVGAIVAVEAVLEPGADADAVDDAIRAACAELPPAARPRSIRFVETLATTGNKLTRGTAPAAG